MTASTSNTTGAATSRMEGFRAWLAEVWPTAVPLFALIVALIAPVAVLVFVFLKSEGGAIAAVLSSLTAILVLSLISRLNFQRGHPAS